VAPPPPPAASAGITINLPSEAIGGLLGAIVVLAGCFGPWVDAVFASRSGLSTDDGKLVAVLAVMAAIVVLCKGGHKTRGKTISIAIVAGLVGVGARPREWGDLGRSADRDSRMGAVRGDRGRVHPGLLSPLNARKT
jgi:hypothetical protein